MTSLTTESVRRTWLMLGVVLALLWGVPQSGSAAPAGQTITGYVQNADLRRVAQAIVELRDPEGALVTSATTTDAGGFLLITPSDGVFSIQAIQDTYRSEHVVMTIAQEAPDPVVLTLTETKEIALEIVEPLIPIKPNSSSETYSVSRKDIESLPRGNNLDLHDVLLTMPSAVYGSLKQVHIRQDHAKPSIPYRRACPFRTPSRASIRICSPPSRAWERADVTLGGMEAQYGNRTTAVIDITSKSGTKPGFGSLGVFGGSNETVLPSFEYGGTAGERFRYYVMNNYRTTNRAIDPPTLGQKIYHGHGESNQTFLRGDYQIDNRNNLTWLLLNSVANSQIPTDPSLELGEEQREIVELIRSTPGLENFTPAPSEQIDENQEEHNQYSHLVWRRDIDDKQFVSVAGYFRHSRATFTTDPYNALSYTSDPGEPFSAGDQDRWAYAGGIRLDYTNAINSKHLIKAGFQFDRTTTKNKTLLYTFAREGGIFDMHEDEDGHHEEDEDGHHDEDEDGHHDEDEDGHHDEDEDGHHEEDEDGHHDEDEDGHHEDENGHHEEENGHHEEEDGHHEEEDGHHHDHGEPVGAVLTRPGAQALTGYREEFWIQDQYTPNDQWTINLGLRLDNIHGYVEAFQVSPRIGVTYTPNKRHAFRAFYGRLFTPPNLETLPFSRPQSRRHRGGTRGRPQCQNQPGAIALHGDRVDPCDWEKHRDPIDGLLQDQHQHG